MKKWIVTLGFILGSTSFANYADVIIKTDKNEYRYDVEPKLADVLTHLSGQKEWHWPNAALYQIKTEALQTKRNKVIAWLKTKANEASGAEKNAIENLSKSISSLNLAKRVDAVIDLDLARVREQHNPTLTQGSYFLKLTSRPNFVTFVGFNQEEKSVDHMPAAHISEYFKSGEINSSGSDYVYVITPKGGVQKAVKSYWGRERIELPPGAKVFLPIPETFTFDGTTSINREIAELIRDSL